MIKKIKVFEAFAGIGSQTKALKNININHEVVAISEWNIYSIIAYDAVHTYNIGIVKDVDRDTMELYLSGFTFSSDGKKPISSLKRLSLDIITKLYKAHLRSRNLGSILEIQLDDIPDFDLLTYSFPCQDLSNQGSSQGMLKGSNTSSSLLWEIGRILVGLSEQNRLPKYLLMENVPALFSKKFIKNYHEWVVFLDSLGYKTYSNTLCAADFDLPQNRTRAYGVSILKTVENSDIFEFPIGNKTTLCIADIIDEASNIDTTLNILTDKLGIFKTKPSGIRSAPLVNYTKFSSENIVYSVQGISPTVTATGAQSRIKIYHNNGDMRYLYPLELWRLMGMSDDDYNNAYQVGIPKIHLVKQAGNSICVTVLEAIFSAMFKIKTCTSDRYIL